MWARMVDAQGKLFCATAILASASHMHAIDSMAITPGGPRGMEHHRLTGSHALPDAQPYQPLHKQCCQSYPCDTMSQPKLAIAAASFELLLHCG